MPSMVLRSVGQHQHDLFGELFPERGDILVHDRYKSTGTVRCYKQDLLRGMPNQSILPIQQLRSSLCAVTDDS